jgi:hypothetical protein
MAQLPWSVALPSSVTGTTITSIRQCCPYPCARRRHELPRMARAGRVMPPTTTERGRAPTSRVGPGPVRTDTWHRQLGDRIVRDVSPAVPGPGGCPASRPATVASTLELQPPQRHGEVGDDVGRERSIGRDAGLEQCDDLAANSLIPSSAAGGAAVGMAWMVSDMTASW